MRIKNGKAIYEEVQCWHCNGTGKIKQGISCPLYWQPVAHHPGHKCPHCGAKNKDSHGLIGEEIIECYICNGKGVRVEDRHDYMPNGFFQSLDFKVYRSNRPQTMNEYLLGFDCVFSCTDYGQYKSMTDEELIVHVKESTTHQYCSVVDKDNTICDHIGIFCNDNGYSVRAVFKQVPDINSMEIERDKGMLRGSLLAGQGLPGTYAIYK
jgi:hypothetical protein